MAAWTGTELIVTDGVSGAAFDAANGTWRTIAPAPFDGGGQGDAVWTGTEMIVWGLFGPTASGSEGAAYDPTSDAWRRIPAAPIGDATRVVWTGDELVVFGDDPSGLIPAGAANMPSAAAAYDPAADRWRRLADPPDDAATVDPAWTGTSILARGSGSAGLFRYDIESDTWTTIPEGSYARARRCGQCSMDA